MHKRITFQTLCLIALLTVTSFFGQSDALAQRTEINDGREFFFGIPHCKKPASEGARGTAPIQLWISSKVKTKAVIKAESEGMNLTLTIEPNQVKVIPLPDALMNEENEMVRDKGISVSSEAPVSVTVFVSYRVSGEAFKVMPVEALGRKYYTLNMYQDKTDEFKPAQILIVATADNTSVTYTPTAATDRVAAGGNKNIIMQKGDTYLIEGKIQPGYNQQKQTDLTGTYIEASKPIAVYSGHTKGAFPRYQPTMLGTPANFMRNMMFDAMWPVEFLGKEYISAPVKYNNRPYSASDPEQKGDLIRFVATEDGTQISQMRDNGLGLQPISLFLKKGQFFDIPEQEKAAYYKANKPVLVGQYGKAWRSSNVTLPSKGTEGDIPLNPSRNGEGMLMTLTPMEQWGSYAVFRSIEEIDNFTLIVFKTNETDSIKFDKQPLRFAFNGIIPIPGTPYSYARKQIGAGDHSFEATSSKIKFAAYAYGNFDNTKDGFAYGYPTSVNYAIACDDSLAVKATPICGDYTGKARALPSTAECASIYNIYMLGEESYNYTFELKTELQPGLKEADFVVNVIDKTKDAKAFVKVINRSGRDTTLEFTYIAQQVVAEPTDVDFGTLSPNQKVCKTVTLRNPGTIDAVITNLKLKNGAANFTVDKSALPITLKPGETRQVEVCAIALPNMEKRDSLLVDLECYSKGLALLRYSTSTAQMDVTPAHFRQVLMGHSATLPVTISNVGKTLVEVYSVDIPATIPFTTSGLMDKFPIKLLPGEEFDFMVTYTPVVAGQDDRFTADFKANTDEINTKSLWTGTGIDVTPIGDERNVGEQRVIDEYVVKNNLPLEYPGTVTFKAEEINATLKITDIKLISNDKNAFRLDQTVIDNLKATGFELDPDGQNRFVSLGFFFAPKERGNFEAVVELSGTTTDDHNNTENRTVTATIKGIGVQPDYTVTDLPYGLVDLNTPTKGIVKIYSVGTKEVEISKLNFSGDKDNFILDPSFRGGLAIDAANPLEIQPGDSLDLPIIFTATSPRDFVARINYETDAANDEGELKASDLTGYAISGDIDRTPYDFPPTYITQTNTSGMVECINKSADSPIEVTAITFDGGADDSRFAITGYKLRNAGTVFTALPITVPANDAVQVFVNFTPDAVRNDYATKVRYTTSLGVVRSDITGIGKIMTSTVSIKENYRVSVGGRTQVSFDLEGSPEAINDGNITNFKATVRFDHNIVQPVPGNTNITLRDMTKGWEVVSANITEKGVFEVIMQTNDASKALKGEGPLFDFTMNGYLDDADQSELPCEMTEFNRPWVVIQNKPGKIVVEPVCGGDLRQIATTSQQYMLMAPAPNPVSGPVVTIRYAVALEAHTRLVLVNSHGETVAVLVDQLQQPGEYEVGVDVTTLGSGNYFYSIQSGPFAKTQHMILTK